MMVENDAPESIRLLQVQWIAWLDFLKLRIEQDFSLLPISTSQRVPPYPIDAADAVASMFDATVAMTCEALSIVGGFKIDDAPYFARFCGLEVSTTARRSRAHGRDLFNMAHIERARSFNPVAVYQAIAADYSPARVEDLKKQALAQSLHAAFCMCDSSVVMRAGCAVLEMSAWAEKTYSMSPRFSYSCSTEQSLMHRLTLLMQLLTAYLDRPGYLPGVEEAFQRIFRDMAASGGFLSRERLSVTPDLTLVLYQRKVEILIKADVAARLNTFLGEWLEPIGMAA